MPRGLVLPTLEELEAESQRRAERRAAEAGRVQRRMMTMAQYRVDPVAFLHDCVAWRAGEEPTVYQEDILRQLVIKRRVAVRALHGVGKTAIAAWAILWFAITRDGDDWKIPTTASAWRQLTKYLWPEVHKWARRLRWDVLERAPFDPRSEMLALSLKLKTGEAFAAASDVPDLIEGAHADHILYIFDEAKAIPAKTFDAAEGAFSGSGASKSTEALALCISTPGPPNGRFYEIHAREMGYEDWWARHVTLAEAIAAGRIGEEWAELRRRQWGEKSAVYRNRILGEFASADEDGVIPLAWIEEANERWRAWKESGVELLPLTTVGVDVGRSGDDLTVLAPRAGTTITELRRFHHQDTMATTGQVVAALRKGGAAIVDVIGVGAGVVDRLRELNQDVLPFNASERCEVKDRSGELAFANLRSAAWWHLRELLDPTNEERIALPPDDKLIGDLTAPKWRVVSSGKIEIESKDTIRQRIGRSTDDGDAVVQAFAREIMGRPSWDYGITI